MKAVAFTLPSRGASKARSFTNLYICISVYTYMKKKLLVLIPVSPGELLDKIVILEIKSKRIRDKNKLQNVRFELHTLRAIYKKNVVKPQNLKTLVRELRSVNEVLWDIEDAIRVRELKRLFDNESTSLARSIYGNNDKRAAIKRELNILLNARFIEEKSYSH